MAGYHKRQISKGVLGESSKIREELEEYEDAMEQDIVIMAACELADIFGALESLAAKHDLDMSDLKSMSDATGRAFKDGTRK